MTAGPARALAQTARYLRQAWRDHPDLIAMALLLLVAVPSRLVLLGTDPPMDVQRHFFWDEGLWAHNARVHELFGVWVIDDHNPPLVLAPLYTLVLTAFYRIFGLGLVATRLVSATSGVLACLILYVAVRAVRTPGRALVATLIFTLSYFVVTHQRVAFTEAHQLLWVVVGLAGVLWAGQQPRWALLGGIGLALAQLVKPSAVILFPVVLGYWVWRSLRVDIAQSARALRVEIGWFAAGVVLVAVPVAAVLLTRWSFVWGYLAVSLRGASSLTYTPSVELIPGIFRLPPTGFALQSMVQVGAVGVLAWRRMLRSREDHADSLECIAWFWLGIGLLSLGPLHYQPDRRFLLLSVPLAVLFATAIEGRLMPSARERVASAGNTRRMLGGGLLGFALGWATMAFGTWLGMGVTPHNWSRLWEVAIIGGGLASLLVPLGISRMIAGIPLTALIPIFLLFEPVRFSINLAHSESTVLDAAGRLAVIARGLPPEDRFMVGIGSSTLSLESTILAIPERNNPNTGAVLNPDAWDRFHPALALEVIPRSLRQSEGGAARQHGFRRCMALDVLDRAGPARTLRFELWIRPDLAGRCEEDRSPGRARQRLGPADSGREGS